MTIPLFSENTRRSFLIRRIMDTYGEEGRRQVSAAVASPPMSAGVRGLQYCLGFFSIREAAPIQLLLNEVFHVRS